MIQESESFFFYILRGTLNVTNESSYVLINCFIFAKAHFLALLSISFILSLIVFDLHFVSYSVSAFKVVASCLA